MCHDSYVIFLMNQNTFKSKETPKQWFSKMVKSYVFHYVVPACKILVVTQKVQVLNQEKTHLTVSKQYLRIFKIYKKVTSYPPSLETLSPYGILKRNWITYTCRELFRNKQHPTECFLCLAQQELKASLCKLATV